MSDRDRQFALMPSLAHALAGWTDGRPVVAGPSRVFSAAALSALIAARRLGDGASLRGGVVAVQVSDQVGLLSTLLWLDGWAGTLLLLPSGLDIAVRDDFLRRSEVEWVVAEEVGGSSWPVPVLPALDSVKQVNWSGELPTVETRWILPTSGTTNIPKLVAHTLASLTRTTNRNREKGAAYVWGLLYEPTRFAGLQVFLQAVLGGSTLVVPDFSSELDERLAHFAQHGVNALSATPTLWRKLLMTKGIESLSLRQTTLGGEIADQAILTTLTRTFPSARVVHIYASTEAGVGFAVTDGLAGFPTSFLQSPPPGVELRLDSDSILLLRPARSQVTYLEPGLALADSEGFIRTGDRIEVRDGRCHFLGRDSGAINVGGNKVMPEEVEAVLHLHPGVALARVGAVKNPITGQLVEARVQPAHPPADPESFKRELRLHCAAHLPPYKVPALLKLVADLSVSSAGKISRQA